MKTFYTIIGLIGIFFFSIPIHLFAATEYNPDAIEVDTLPECNQQVVDNVYAYNNHYWKCNLIPGELRNIQVGDVLLDKSIYFTFPETDDFYNSIPSGNVISFDAVYYTYEGSSKKSSLAIKRSYFNNLKTLEFNYSALVSPIYIYKEKQKQMDSIILSLPLENIYSASFEVLSVDTTNPVYQYIKVAASESMYEYEEQGEIPSLYTYEDKDYGTVRIVASSRNLACGSIIQFDGDIINEEGRLKNVL